MLCPLNRQPSAGPCSRRPCSNCAEDLLERAAILEFGMGTGNPREEPTCRSRLEADALALEQAKASLPGQRALAQ